MGLRRIVLWDIDHTLIDTRGVGRELSGIAFERVTGRRMERQARIDGLTEPVIFPGDGAAARPGDERGGFRALRRGAGGGAPAAGRGAAGAGGTHCPGPRRRWTLWLRYRGSSRLW
ncbi:hypothetical protein GCM10020000_06120 [Streptomyces olivoverticillatus]